MISKDNPNRAAFQLGLRAGHHEHLDLAEIAAAAAFGFEYVPVDRSTLITIMLAGRDRTKICRAAFQRGMMPGEIAAAVLEAAAREDLWAAVLDR